MDLVFLFVRVTALFWMRLLVLTATHLVPFTPGSFLSYARSTTSTSFARWLKAELEQHGWLVWMDEADIGAEGESLPAFARYDQGAS